MKILHTADWHIGRNLFEFSLLEDQAYIFDQIYRLLKDNKVDVLIASGDLFDRSVPSAQAVELLDEILSTLIHKCGVKVVAISGNHDSAKRIAYGNSFFRESGLFLEGCWKPELKKITLSDANGPVNFFLLPYFLPQEVRLAYDDSEINSCSKAFEAIISHNLDEIVPTERNLLVAHGFFMKLRKKQAADFPEVLPSLLEPSTSPICSSSELSVGTSDLTDLSPASVFDYVALGHLHSPQSAGDENLRYSGSLLKYSPSEAKSSKSVTLLDWHEKGKLEISQIPLVPRRDLRVISGTMEQLLDKENQAGLSLEDYIYANLVSSGAVLNAMSQLRSVFPNAIGLNFISPEELSQSLEWDNNLTDESLEELFSRFYKDMMGEDLSKKRQQRVERIAREITRETTEKGALHNETN